MPLNPSSYTLFLYSFASQIIGPIFDGCKNMLPILTFTSFFHNPFPYFVLLTITVAKKVLCRARERGNQ